MRVQPGRRRVSVADLGLDERGIIPGLDLVSDVRKCRRECMDSPAGNPARARKVLNERSNVRSVMRPPRSPGHRLSDRSAVGKRARPAGESQNSSRPTTQLNSGLVRTVRRRGPDPLVPFAYRISTHPKFLYPGTCGLGPKSAVSSIASSRRRRPYA